MPQFAKTRILWIKALKKEEVNMFFGKILEFVSSNVLKIFGNLYLKSSFHIKFEMEVTAISLKEIPGLIEKQKQLALSRPIYAFCSEASKSAFESIIHPFREIYQSDSIYSINNPTNADEMIASSVPRTLVFFLYQMGRDYLQAWINGPIQQRLSNFPSVDLFSVELKFGEPDKVYEMYGFRKFPCALVYRMGHLVDQIYPEHEPGVVSAEVRNNGGYISEMLRRNKVVLSKEEIEVDRDDVEFEQRYRERQMIEKKKENEEKMKHHLEVKRKIEEDKLERQRKFGK